MNRNISLGQEALDSVGNALLEGNKQQIPERNADILVFDTRRMQQILSLAANVYYSVELSVTASPCILCVQAVWQKHRCY